MKTRIILGVLCLSSALLRAADGAAENERRLAAEVPQVFARAEAQARLLIKEMDARGVVTELPRSWTRGTYKTEPPTGWTTGFFPGSLWYLYAYTQKPEWKAAAEAWTARLEPARHFTKNHDMGFMFFCSYGNGIK